MNNERRAQASDTTPFNMSNHATFDFDFKNPNRPINSSSTTTTVAGRLKDMSIDDPFNTCSAASEDISMANASQPTTTNTLNPTAQVASPQMPPSTPLPQEQSAYSIPALDDATQREPSKWTLLSPELQTQLNEMYASQLAQLASGPHPPSATLFLTAGGSAAFLVPATRQVGTSGAWDPVSATRIGSSMPRPGRANHKRARDDIEFDDDDEPEPGVKRKGLVRAKALGFYADGGKCGGESLTAASETAGADDDVSDSECFADNDSDDLSDASGSSALTLSPIPMESILHPPRSHPQPHNTRPSWRYEQKGKKEKKKAMLDRGMQRLRRESEEARGDEVGEV